MFYVLIAAVAAGAGVGAARSLAGPSPAGAESAVPASEAAPPTAMAKAEWSAPEASAAEAIEGQVLEVLQVPNYTYLRLGAKAASGTWVAVPTTSMALGASGRVSDAMKMTDFTSTALKRTFSVIYFGTLDTDRPAPGAAPPLGTPAWSQDPHLNPRDLDSAGAAGAPHAPLGPVAVKTVDRATGPSGRTVAELCAQRTELAGKTVRIHATVVKATPGVLGHTYLHLRDGSGDPAAGTHDVAATTDATPVVGDIVVVEGVVALDRDIGSGYKFPILVENATLVGAP
jgi:hypothetical protein